MEPLFENTHVRDREFFKEFYLYAMFRRPVAILALSVAALMFVGGLIGILMGDTDTLVIYSLIFPIVFGIFYGVVYVKNVRLMYARECEKVSGGEVVYTARIFEDRVAFSTSLGATMELEWSKIKNIISTKQYLLLQTEAKQCLHIKRDCFTQGTYESLCEFLRQKGYQVK